MIKPSKNLSKREIIICSVTLAVISIAYFKFWLAGESQKMQIVENKINSTRVDLDNNKKIAEELQRRSIASVPLSQEESFDKYVNQNKRLGSILAGITQSNEEISDLQVKRLTLLSSKSEREFSKYSFEMELEGSFIDVGSFLEKIEVSKLVAEVKSVDIARAEKDLKRCVAKIKIDTYLFAGDL